jgi:NAD(P)-dependent dehydrogenase (short-subunit alcohol dehydrogenase family)
MSIDILFTALTAEGLCTMSKTVLITGTSSGFGRDIAETLAQAGNQVFASMRDSGGRNRAAADALALKGVQIIDIDVTQDTSVEAGIAAVVARAGRIDVLINNAGIGSAGLSETYTTDQLRALFEVNVFGVQRTLRAALPTLRHQGEGLVINIGSVLGRVTLPFMGLYGASKFALEALSDSYRYELSHSGIDVVLVQPSAYPTSIFASSQQPADAGRAAEYGVVADIAQGMLQGFTDRLQGAQAPNPHEVAEAISRLVEQPRGSRPGRVVVGSSYGADSLNTSSSTAQKQLIEGLGLGQLEASVKIQAAA